MASFGRNRRSSANAFWGLIGCDCMSPHTVRSRSFSLDRAFTSCTQPSLPNHGARPVAGLQPLFQLAQEPSAVGLNRDAPGTFLPRVAGLVPTWIT